MLIHNYGGNGIGEAVGHFFSCEYFWPVQCRWFTAEEELIGGYVSFLPNLGYLYTLGVYVSIGLFLL